MAKAHAKQQHIRLVHWKESEADGRAERLRKLGYEVDATVPGTSIGIEGLREDPPDAFLLDLGRLPSHGLEVARAVRLARGLRQIPIVFVDGKPDKVAAIREQVPDATYTAWPDIGPALENAIANPPADPVVPRSPSGSPSGPPLHRKLGIKPGSTLALVDVPDDIERSLAPLPEGVTIRRSARGQADLTILFTRSLDDLLDRLPLAVKRAETSGLWIAWPKGSSGVETDLTENVVREPALDAGLVDHKIVSIDSTWSGLRFAKRRS